MLLVLHPGSPGPRMQIRFDQILVRRQNEFKAHAAHGDSLSCEQRGTTWDNRRYRDREKLWNG